MVLTVQSCLGHIEHSLGGSLSTQMDEVALLDEAGHYLVSMHEWGWLDRPSVPLHTRASFSVNSTSGTWNNTHKHVTVAGAFASYSFLEGDSILMTAGSGAWEPGNVYKIAGKYDAGQIFLDPTLATTDAMTGSAFTVRCTGVSLPVDFANVIDIQPTEGLVNSFQMVDPAFLNQLRTNEVAVGNFRYFGSIVRGDQPRKMKGAGAYRLELYPTATAQELNKFTMFYRAGWQTLSGSENVYIPIPDYCETLYKQLVRTFARGYEEDDVASLNQRLAEIEAGPIFKNAKERDGNAHNSLGQMAGGAVRQQEMAMHQYLKSSVLGPS